MQKTNARRVIAAGAIGNVLEWYDFAIYGYFAASIGRAFFPKEDPVAQVLSAFGIFAVGYLMRPIGGALVGHIGDRLGRRAALTFSIVAMAIPTFLVGVLPGYAVLGVAAPIVLTLLRMIQGLSVGGEYTTSVVFMVEHAPPGRRGLIGAMACCGAVGGLVMGSATGALLGSVLSADDMARWGWRIPFLMGLVVGLAGLILRRHIKDEAPRAEGKAPFGETVRNNFPLLLKLAGLSVFNSVGFYLLFVYIVSWLQMADGIAPQHALEINTASMLVLLPCMIFMGALSDRIGRKPVLLAATLLAFVTAVPLFWLMHHDRVVDRHVPGNAAHHHGGRGSGRDPLHRCGAGLQRDPGRDRRHQPDGGDLAGASHGEPAQPGLHDHDRRGDFLRGHPDVPRTQQGVTR
jgi:MHS family proline/betaine transporter-like MFS transporter